MAQVRLANTFRYIGASADAKATAGVPAGSTWYEADTLRRFVYDGTDWQVQR